MNDSTGGMIPNTSENMKDMINASTSGHTEVTPHTAENL